MAQGLLLPAFYLPNISYFQAIKRHNGPIELERFEHFPKQTFRNRTRIATAGGALTLTVPIQHGRKDRVAVKDIRINYDHPWQRLHWLSMQTAYRSSAYFEFYEDDLRPFYQKHFTYLFDFHLQQLQLILKLLKIDRDIQFTDAYHPEVGQGVDYRNQLHPKRPSLLENQPPYYQLFQEKHGFLPDLSIVDLLFNQGPESKHYF